jgi:cell division protein FtsN
MARDYSARRSGNKNPAKAKRNKRRTQPAARTAQKRNARSGPPGCLWFVCGLCLAIAVAAGLYIFVRPVGSDTQRINIDTPNGAPRKPARNASASGKDQAEQSGRQAAGNSGPSQQKPRFSFYKLLPNYKVVIPRAKPPARAPDTSSAGTTPQAAPTALQRRASGRYIIQTGAFSTYADADRRKARLALLGISSRIVDSKLSSGKTIYRVQSEPMTSSDKLRRLVKRLHAHHIDSLVMQAKK